MASLDKRDRRRLVCDRLGFRNDNVMPCKRNCRRLVCDRLGFRIDDNPLIGQLSFVSEARYRGLALLGPNGAGKTAALETGKGNLALALALGIILVALSLFISLVVQCLRHRHELFP